jgi:hypothetical protein
MNYYYLDAANQPAGPLPLEEIRRQSAAGEIPVHPMIAAVGSNRWQPLDGGSAATAGFPFDTYFSDRVDEVLRFARKTLSPGFLHGSLSWAENLGHIAVLLGGAAGLVYIIYTAAQRGAWLSIGGGLVLIAGLLCAQFAARRFFSANETLFTPTRITNPALLDGLALLALFSTVSLLLGSITACISFGVWEPLLPTFLIAALWIYFAAVALHPEAVKVESAPQGAGEEVVGIIAFLMKTALKLLPLLFFTWAVVGCLANVLTFFDLGEYVLQLAERSQLPLPRNFRFQGIGLVIAACLIVPVAHLLFLAVSLPLDLWRALLSVPAKLDALKK